MFHLDTYIIVSLALVVFSHVLMLAAMFVPFKNGSRGKGSMGWRLDFYHRLHNSSRRRGFGYMKCMSAKTVYWAVHIPDGGWAKVRRRMKLKRYSDIAVYGPRNAMRIPKKPKKA